MEEKDAHVQYGFFHYGNGSLKKRSSRSPHNFNIDKPLARFSIEVNFWSVIVTHVSVKVPQNQTGLKFNQKVWLKWLATKKENIQLINHYWVFLA